MISDTPVLIVNADDLGWNRPTTDMTLQCFRAGRATSATLLVNMDDSERAGGLALEAGLPVGLHLNLTDPFTARDIPPDVRERQMRAVRHYGAPAVVWRSRRWIYDPRAAELTRVAVADQLERFRELCGREPTHVDGHNHVHVCPNVAAALPSGMRVRTTMNVPPLSSGPMAWLSALRQRLTLGDRVAPRHFLNITGLHPDFVEGGPRRLLELSQTTSVEVMSHPGFGHEYSLLMGDDWAQWTDGLPLGSFRDLA